MDNKTQAEELLAHAISPTLVSRDKVRKWVMATRSQTIRRARLHGLAGVLGFLIAATTIWFSLQHQAGQVRQLVSTQPSKTMITLEEITQELCQSRPAEYFVRQISRSK